MKRKVYLEKKVENFVEQGSAKQVQNDYAVFLTQK